MEFNKPFEFNEYQICILFFKNVSNACDIRELILKGEFPCAAIKPRLILDELQVKFAAQLALNSKMNQSLKTHSVYSEIIYNLSPNRKISDSLKKFGIDGHDRQLICVILNETDRDVVCNIVKGDLVSSYNELDQCNHEEVKNFYKIKDVELLVGPLLDAMINRITTKELVSW